MNHPTYDQLLEFYYNFLEAEQDKEIEENEIIELLQALLNGYHDLAENIIKLRKTVNNQCIKLQIAGFTEEKSLPFFDLYSDFQQDFSYFKAYQKYEKFLNYLVKSDK